MSLEFMAGMADVKPINDGIDVERLSALKTFFEDQLQDKRIQGASYLISKNGKVVAEAAVGRRTCREGSDELTTRASGNIYEVTMTFTATAILQLVEQGKISLHQPVADLLDEFDNPHFESITVFHLLTQTSGLIANPHIRGESFHFPHFEWQSTFKGHWLQGILSFPLSGKPGERHELSYANYAVLGVIIEKVTGASYETYIENHILQPLGMNDSFFAVPQDKRNQVLYSFEWQEWGINDSDTRMPRSFIGLNASLHDLIRFGQMLLSGGMLDGTRILSKRSVTMMTSNNLSDVKERSWGKETDNCQFGLGWNVLDGQGVMMSPGTYWQGNAMCGLYIDPKEGLIYTYFVPNSTWNFEVANALPRSIVWSALSPARNEGEAAQRTDTHSILQENTVKQLDRHLKELVASGSIQGASYLLACDGECLAKNATGILEYGSKKTLERDTVYLVSSLNKLLTMIAVMQLVEDGKLMLTQPVKDIIAELDTDQHRKIEIFHLLNHTSGLSPEPGMFGEPSPNGWWEYRFLYDGEQENSAKWIKAILTGPSIAAPGKKRLYSTAGYILLGEVIARVSGIPYEQYVKERILQPLGMEATYFTVPEHLHNKVAVADEWQDLLLRTNRTVQGDPPRSGAGIYCTIDDLHRLGQMLLDGGVAREGSRVLGRSSIEMLERNEFMRTPGLLWAGANDRHFPCGDGLYPLKQPDFPMPYYHDSVISCALILEPSYRFAAVVVVPSTIDWSPEPLVQSKNIILSGLQ
ncbi:CubicO group peptidase (beta-lactamase class C family) [Paenibacillus castaneae]|uniref:serine hydrolase domain-containing protein n=1 Tax=Paenibacillus castaneae TaxID=474957 RepID=UPI00141AAF1C|nr:serine hydrolase domain-containing protein [Paenibacillus castaneae]NIK75166.1 CubicO group peptidase (beta-lactamase class C family) [Paenibacillus castaneae]